MSLASRNRRRNRRVWAAAVVVSLALAPGCQNTQLSKQDWGSVLGAAGGALAGAAIAGDKRWLGAAIGGAVGFYAGRMIGRYLDERDRTLLANRTVEALEDPNPGSATWQSDRSDASAEIETGEVQYTTRTKEVRRLREVQAVPSITLENRQYQTTSALRVRTGPSTQYEPVATLSPGEVVRSAGRTENGWLMLAKSGVTMGYVHGGYVKPYDPLAQARAEGIDLDSVELASIAAPEAFGGIDLDAVEVETSTVQAKAGCRELKVQVNTERGTQDETTQACQNDEGVWELG